MRPFLLLSTVVLSAEPKLFFNDIFSFLNKLSLERNSCKDNGWFHPELDEDCEVPQSNVAHHEPVNDAKVYNLFAVTDMDKNAGTPTDWTWRAVTRNGTLTISEDKTNVTVIWIKDSDWNLTTHLNVKGRAMELSDLSRFNGRLLSPDDKTGIVYEIKDSRAIPWVFLNSGPGNTTHGMKGEWTTRKGRYLYVGGHGTEYRDKNGNVVSEDPMWIKVVSASGGVQSFNWKDVYGRVRAAVNITSPGYLTHEAVQWSAYHQKWFFLPRKESQTIYNEREDEKRIGILSHRERGFSAFEFVPQTNDELIVALKSEEVSGQPAESYITVFDINGSLILDDQKLEDQYKFEGIYFV